MIGTLKTSNILLKCIQILQKSGENHIIERRIYKKTYLYCTPALSNGHGSCTFHFQHQSLHGKNSRGGIALTPSFCVHNFFQSIQYRKCIVRFDRSRDPNIFYQNNLLKNDDNFICICNLMNKINYILLGIA